MSENLLSQNSREDDIDIRELFIAIWKGKWIIITTTFVFFSVALWYALSLPNIYRSEVLLAPVTEESGLNIPGQLGGLAALAGVNLGGGGSEKNVLSLEIVKSREFLGRFIQKYDLFVPIMASEGWSRSSNSLVIDSSVYSSERQEWVRDVSPPFSSKPSLLETHEEFMKLFQISQDKSSGMVTFAISHYSPFLAQEWASLLVKEINNEMRNRELNEAQESIAYLNEKIDETTIADVREMLFSLIEEQSKTLMLASVRDEYVFKTVDPAVASEKKAKPARAMICILAIILAVMLSSIFVLVSFLTTKGNK